MWSLSQSGLGADSSGHQHFITKDSMATYFWLLIPWISSGKCSILIRFKMWWPDLNGHPTCGRSIRPTHKLERMRSSPGRTGSKRSLGVKTVNDSSRLFSCFQVADSRSPVNNDIRAGLPPIRFWRSERGSNRMANPGINPGCGTGPWPKSILTERKIRILVL